MVKPSKLDPPGKLPTHPVGGPKSFRKLHGAKATREVAILAALGLWLAWSTPGNAEIIVGITGGIVISGDQDLTFESRDRVNVVTARNVDESLGPIGGATITAWGDRSLLRYIALQGDLLYWYMEATPALTPPAPRFTVGQHRYGFFLSPLVRLPIYPSFGRFSAQLEGDTFAYTGAGMGAVSTSVEHGNTGGWEIGLQLLGGISIPVTSNLRFRVEGRYLLTADLDSQPRGPQDAWVVNTSGTPTKFRLDSHHDTRFYPVLFGLDWRF